MSTSPNLRQPDDGDTIFNFKLPKEGLALYGAEMDGNTPVLLYKASPNVPTVQIEEVATVFRLVAEGKRPEFFYLPFPPTHPLCQSRHFMYYSPTWLRHTEVGKLLADADWIMKCLQVGARTNEEKTKFFSWSHSSELEGLATRLDFPKVKYFGSVIMSCEYAKVQKTEKEIWFPEEPKMRITDETCPLYSKYITEIFPSIAYYDEPKFLKMQELIKLILIVEWFCKEKGLQVNREWMMDHTTQSTYVNGVQPIKKKPPYDMIPQPRDIIRPSKDVNAITQDSEMYKFLTDKCGVKYRYGYLDFGGAEMIMFKDDGTEFLRQKCLKIFAKYFLFDTVPIYKRWLYAPLPEEVEATPDIMLEQVKRVTIPAEQKQIVSVKEEFLDDTGLQVELKQPLTPSPSLGPLELATIVSATVDNYNHLFASEDPNEPIPYLNEIIIPGVNSWDELIEELTAPIPRFWQDPFIGLGIPTSGGGVTTRNIKEERVQGAVAESQMETESIREESVEGAVAVSQAVNMPVPADIERERESNFGRRGDLLKVRGSDRTGKIQKVTSEKKFRKLVIKFKKRWVKGTPPPVIQIFAISNFSLERKWIKYGEKIKDNQFEENFHGTLLNCDITTAGRLCMKASCGICGIAQSGMNHQENADSSHQVFGKGFYLASASSMAHYYTERNNAQGYRAMLLCKVLPGRKCYPESKMPELTCPPDGYDCVYSNNDPHSEIVVYDSHAVFPCYIIVYKMDD